MSMSVDATMRHTCTGCGGSCRGVVVRLTAEEVARITRLAPSVGVDDAVQDNALRRVRGACVFLDTAGQCTLHRAHGAASKPAICRQYPVVAVATEQGVRIGLDPGCYTHATTWQTAPMVTGGDLQATPVQLAAPDQAAETAVLDLFYRQDNTVAATLRALIAAPDGEALPEGLMTRFTALLVAADLPGVVAHDSFGESWRAGLSPLRGLVEADVPAAVAPEREVYLLDVARRLVFLRLLRRVGSPVGGALLTLAGGVVLAARAPDDAAFGQAMAAWARSLRSPQVLGALLPSADALRWRVRGGSR